VKGHSKLRLLTLLLLAALAVFAVLPFLARARRTTSMNSCFYNMMWIETAKAQWALAEAKALSASPTPDELLPYLAQVTPMWDGQATGSKHPPTVFPTCILTNAPYVIGNVATRIQCPTMAWAPTLHAWNESEYRYHYRLR
jgi:hypothetical protein